MIGILAVVSIFLAACQATQVPQAKPKPKTTRAGLKKLKTDTDKLAEDYKLLEATYTKIIEDKKLLIQTHKNDLQQEIDEQVGLEKIIHSKQHERIPLLNAVTVLTDQVKTAKEEKIKLTEEVKNLRFDNDVLGKTVNVLKDEYTRMIKERENIKKMIETEKEKKGNELLKEKTKNEKEIREIEVSTTKVKDQLTALKGELDQLNSRKAQLEALKTKAETECQSVRNTLCDINIRKDQLIHEREAAIEVLKEEQQKVLVRDHLKKADSNCVSAEYFANKLGIPPYLLTALILCLIVVLALIVLIVWKSCKMKGAPQFDPYQNDDNYDDIESFGEYETKKHRATRPYTIDINEENESAGQTSSEYRPKPMQSHLRPIVCRAKPALFVSEE